MLKWLCHVELHHVIHHLIMFFNEKETHQIPLPSQNPLMSQQKGEKDESNSNCNFIYYSLE